MLGLRLLVAIALAFAVAIALALTLRLVHDRSDLICLRDLRGLRLNLTRLDNALLLEPGDEVGEDGRGAGHVDADVVQALVQPAQTDPQLTARDQLRGGGRGRGDCVHEVIACTRSSCAGGDESPMD